MNPLTRYRVVEVTDFGTSVYEVDYSTTATHYVVEGLVKTWFRGWQWRKVDIFLKEHEAWSAVDNLQRGLPIRTIIGYSEVQ